MTTKTKPASQRGAVTRAGERQNDPRPNTVARPRVDRDDTFAARVGQRIRARRDQRSLSVKDVSRALEDRGVKAEQPTIYSWENGRSPVPLAVLPHLAAIFGCKIHDLVPTQ